MLRILSANYSNLRLTKILLLGYTSLDFNTNSSIPNATIRFVISFKRSKDDLKLIFSLHPEMGREFLNCQFFLRHKYYFYKILFCIPLPIIVIFQGITFMFAFFSLIFGLTQVPEDISWHLLIVFLSCICMRKLMLLMLYTYVHTLYIQIYFPWLFFVCLLLFCFSFLTNKTIYAFRKH